MKINSERLLKNLEELSYIGRNEGGGIDRAFGSKSDLEAREWLIRYWKEHLGIETRIDAAANLWVDYQKKEGCLPLVIGSHHDAVPDGGRYDGALGVLLATEILETLMEAKLKLNHPLSVVSFTGEEPNPFNLSTIGSKVLCGRLTRESLENCISRDNGERIADALARAGGNLERLPSARLTKEDLFAFLECHIEQGSRLEKKNLPTAAVTCITGIYREQYTVQGEANHAGTTVMTDRKDAYLAAAELSLMLEQIALEFQDDDVVATVGYVEVQPNEANIIPGVTQCIVDIRTYDTAVKALFVARITDAVSRIEEKRGVKIKREVLLDQLHMPMHPDVIQAVCQGVQSVQEKVPELVSMAGHDAANLARVTKSGMIFVRSVDGKSHCKEEYSTPEDIEKVGNAMLQAVLALDRSDKSETI